MPLIPNQSPPTLIRAARSGRLLQRYENLPIALFTAKRLQRR